jgi:CHC2 zinc finger/Reverse transcriptase (RNA-dependent DNA polymerase)
MEGLQALAGTSAKERPSFTYHTQRVNGKIRNIAVPNFAMRLLHWELIDRLRQIEVGLMLHNSYGAMRGGSVVANASRHANNRYIYQLDIRRAYESVPLDRLTDALYWLDPTLGSPPDIDAFLQTYCAGKNGGLAIGGPASPTLFDLYCASEIDPKVRKVCSRAMYSRYLDDLTISQNEPIPSIVRRRVREAIEECGLTVSHRKSFLTDRHKHTVTITGVVITRSGTIRPTSEFMARVRKALFIPVEEVTQLERFRLRGMAGHLFQFTDQHQWPYGKVSRDVRNLQHQLLGRLGATRAPSQYGHLPFSRYFLDEVRAVPLQEVVKPYVQKFRKYGNEYEGLCPYHQEKTRSFTVAPDKGFYHCFGCGAHGDVIQFVMEFERCTFPEAVRNIASRYNIQERW